jgi:Na+/pantothenate symporter
MIDIRIAIKAQLMPIAGFLCGSIWIWLGTFGMPWIWLVPFLIITAWLQYRHLVERARATRRLFFDAYLAPDSAIQRYRDIGPATKLFWTVSALILCLVTAISVFSYGSAHTIAVLFGIATGFILAVLTRKLWLQHAHLTFRSDLDSKAVTGAAVLAGAIALFSWEMLSNRADHANLTSTHAADTVIRETHHPVKWVQHMARTNQYASLTMLRMRDNLGNAAGNLIYAYLIIPNLFPIYGMVAIIKSCIFLLSSKPRDP